MGDGCYFKGFWGQTPVYNRCGLARLASAFIRQALCELFKLEADFEVCGEAENGRAGEIDRNLRVGLAIRGRVCVDW